MFLEFSKRNDIHRIVNTKVNVFFILTKFVSSTDFDTPFLSSQVEVIVLCEWDILCKKSLYYLRHSQSSQ